MTNGGLFQGRETDNTGASTCGDELMVAGTCNLYGPYKTSAAASAAFTAGKVANTDKWLGFQGADGGIYAIQITGA